MDRIKAAPITPFQSTLSRRTALGAGIGASLLAEPGRAAGTGAALAGSAETSANGVPAYCVDTIARFRRSVVPDEVGLVNVEGYYVAGVGAARYRRAGTEPAHPGKVADASGAWFEIAEPVLDITQFGARSGEFANATAIQNAFDCAASLGSMAGGDFAVTGGQVTAPKGAFGIERGLKQHRGIIFSGAGRNATRLFPTRDFTGTIFLTIGETTDGATAFGTVLERMVFDNTVAMIANLTFVYSTCVQEGCVVRDCQFERFTRRGAHFSGHGSLLPAAGVVQRCDFWAAPGADDGIFFENCAGQMIAQNITGLMLGGHAGQSPFQALRARNARVTVQHLHYEGCSVAGVLMENDAHGLLMSVSGGNSPPGAAAIKLTPYSGTITILDAESSDADGFAIIDEAAKAKMPRRVSMYVKGDYTGQAANATFAGTLDIVTPQPASAMRLNGMDVVTQAAGYHIMHASAFKSSGARRPDGSVTEYIWGCVERGTTLGDRYMVSTSSGKTGTWVAIAGGSEQGYGPASSRWNGPHLTIGQYHLWIDEGRVYFQGRPSAPLSAHDGVALMECRSGRSTERPRAPHMGDYYFDSSLGKPIWCKLAGEQAIWVDASGDTV